MIITQKFICKKCNEDQPCKLETHVDELDLELALDSGIGIEPQNCPYNSTNPAWKEIK